MTEIDDVMARQAAWQENRRRLPWPVKIKMAELLRDAVRQLRNDASGARRSECGGTDAPKTCGSSSDGLA